MSGKPNKVGYRNPPTASRFKKGHSGNPGGRKKGSRNLATLVRAELERPIVVTQDGKRCKVSKVVALARLQVDRALKGDPRAFEAIVRMEEKFEQHAARARSDEQASEAGCEIPHTAYAEALRALIDRERPEPTKSPIESPAEGSE